MTEFKVGKTYKSRGGDEFKVIHISNNEHYPVIAVDTEGIPEAFTANGNHYFNTIDGDHSSSLDLALNYLFKKGDLVISNQSGAEVLVTKGQRDKDNSFEGVVIKQHRSTHEKGTHNQGWASSIFSKVEEK